MSISDYVVSDDKFEAEDGHPAGYCFPCYACIYRGGADWTPPCSECGHNANAKKDGAV